MTFNINFIFRVEVCLFIPVSVLLTIIWVHVRCCHIVTRNLLYIHSKHNFPFTSLLLSYIQNKVSNSNHFLEMLNDLLELDKELLALFTTFLTRLDIS